MSDQNWNSSFRQPLRQGNGTSGFFFSTRPNFYPKQDIKNIRQNGNLNEKHTNPLTNKSSMPAFATMAQRYGEKNPDNIISSGKQIRFDQPTTSYGTLEAYGKFWDNASDTRTKNNPPEIDPMDEVLSSSDEDESSSKQPIRKMHDSSEVDQINSSYTRMRSPPRQPIKRIHESSEERRNEEDLYRKRYARRSRSPSPNIPSDEQKNKLYGFGIMVKNIPSHITEESLKFMANCQGYPPTIVRINKIGNTRNAIVYFATSADGLAWIQLNQGCLKFSHGQSSELEIVPGQSTMTTTSETPKPRTTLLPTPNLYAQQEPIQTYQSNVSNLMNLAKNPSDQQWLSDIIKVANQSTTPASSSGYQKEVEGPKWTCYKCMSQNPINNFNCLKCKGTKQESEELEAKGSQYVGLAACDTLLIRDLPLNVDEMIIRMSIMQYMDVVPDLVQIADSKKYCFIQMKSTEEASMLLNLFNKAVTPMINHAPVVITFSRKPLRQINAEKEQQKVDNTQWSKINYDQKTKPLTSYSKKVETTITTVDTPFGRFKIYRKPNPANFEFEATSGYYHDSVTGFYYDKNSEYYYDVDNNAWMFWTSRYSTFIPCEGGMLEEKKRLQEEEKLGVPSPNKKKTLLPAPGLSTSQDPAKILEEAKMKAPETYEFIKNLMQQNQQIIQALNEKKIPERAKNPLLSAPAPYVHKPPLKKPNVVIENDQSRNTLPKNHELWSLNAILTMKEQEHRDILIKIRSSNEHQLDDVGKLAEAYVEYEIHGIRKFLNNMFKFAIRTLPERLADDDTAGNGFDPALYDAGKSKKFAFILGICAICNQKGHQGPECWAPVFCIQCAQIGHQQKDCKNTKASREEVIDTLMKHKNHIFHERLRKMNNALLHLKKCLGLVNPDTPEDTDIREVTGPAKEMLGKSLTWQESALQNAGLRSLAGPPQKVYNGPINLNALNALVGPKEDLPGTSSPRTTSAASMNSLPEVEAQARHLDPIGEVYQKKTFFTTPISTASFNEPQSNFFFQTTPKNPVKMPNTIKPGLLDKPETRIIDVNELLRTQNTSSANLNPQSQLNLTNQLVDAPNTYSEISPLQEMELALVQQQIFMLEQESEKNPTQDLVQQQLFMLEQESKKNPTQFLSSEAFDLNALNPVQVTEEMVFRQVTQAVIPKESGRFVRKPLIGEKAAVNRENAQKSEVIREKALIHREETGTAMRTDLWNPEDIDMRESEDTDLREPKASRQSSTSLPDSDKANSDKEIEDNAESKKNVAIRKELSPDTSKEEKI